MLSLVACSCGPSVEYIPTTPEEREKVRVALDLKLPDINMSLEKYTVAKVIEVREHLVFETRKNICRPTQWEHKGSWDGAVKTGRWRYLGESQWRNEAIN